MSNSKPASTAAGSAPLSKQAQASEALRLMEQALDLIDAAEGPDDAGAHLVFAIARLKEWIAGSGTNS